MAVPFGAEDLKKLKVFIDFVSGNPTMLNAPPLSFVKEFIEGFGGKVPAGEYKMPGGGCPFGGGGADNVKAEAKPTESESDSEKEAPEVETESESDLELDMEVTYSAEKGGSDLVSTNSIYIQDPPDLRENSKTNKFFLKSKSCENSVDDEAYDMDILYESCNESDPIDAAPKVTIKIESDFEHCESIIKKNKTRECDKDSTDLSAIGSNYSNYQDDLNDLDYTEELDAMNDTDLSDTEKTCKHINPLNTRRRSKNVVKRDQYLTPTDAKKEWPTTLYYRKRKRQPKPVNCTENCKHKCNLQKVTEAQRKFLCAEFWSHKPEGQRNYLLKFIESRYISKIKSKRSNRPSRGYTNAYYLINVDGKRVRVCLNYFRRTFCITSYTIKLATENRDVGDIQKKMEKGKTVSKKNTEKICARGGQVNNKMSIAGVDNNEVISQPKKKSTKKKRERNVKRERSPQPVNCDEVCIMKCTTNFTAEQRSQICQQFWTMDFKRQKDFVLSKIETRDVESLTAKEYRTSTRARRTFSNRYYFRGARGNNIRVCAKFFMATLCIGRHVIHNAIKFADQQTGSYAGEDRRGRHTPGNKIPDDLVQDVKHYIESFPTWVPHKNYKTRYLHSSLSIQQMWRDYKRLREADGRKYCSASFFRQIFHKDYRLSFLKPNSKSAQKMSATTKPSCVSDFLSRKIFTNVSEFTGKECGGFWLEPTKNNERSVLWSDTQRMALFNNPETLTGDRQKLKKCYVEPTRDRRQAERESAMLTDYIYSERSSVPFESADIQSTPADTDLYTYNIRCDEQPKMFQTL